MATTKKDVAKKNDAELPVPLEEFEGMEGQGFEDTDKDAYAIPFLRVLQSNSPQCNEDEDSYIKGAKPGMMFNTITGDLYGKEVEIIPVHYTRDFVEWRPNRGGFVQSHGSDPAILERVEKIDDKNNQILDNGNVIQDTRNHYILIADKLVDGPVIFSLNSTGVRHSRKWMTLLSNLVLPNSTKKAPMFAGVWRVSTVQNENDDGKWYQVGNKSMTAIEYVRWVNSRELDAARGARKLITSGTTRADYDSLRDSDNKPKEEDIPF